MQYGATCALKIFLASIHLCKARISGDKTTRLHYYIARMISQRPEVRNSMPTPVATLANGRRRRWLWCERCAGRRGVAGIEQAVFASAPECVRPGRRSAELSSRPPREPVTALRWRWGWSLFRIPSGFDGISFPDHPWGHRCRQNRTSGRGLAPAKPSWSVAWAKTRPNRK
jgi:hypothetical protein